MEEKKSVLSKPLVAYALSVIVWMGWGSAAPIIKKCYVLFSISGTAAPEMFGGSRYLIASLMLFIISWIKNGRFPIISKTDFKKVLLLGTVQTGLAPFFQYIALNYISGTNSGIVNSTAPFFLTIFSAIYFKDKISARKIVGIIIGFIGVMFCFFEGGSLGITFLGEGFFFIQVLFFCLGSMIAKVIATELDPITTTAYNLLFGGSELFLFGALSGGHISNGGVTGFVLLLYIAMVSCFCYMMWTALCSVHSVSKLAPFQFISPLTGAIVSGIVLKENILQLKYVVAIILVSVGTIIATTTRNNKKI